MSQQDHFGHEHYRSLFEGSQASLADMAARQAQALARVGRLRSAIVAVLRKNFMELSAQAEANLGGRLSEIDDEIILAYLDAFTAAASRGDQRATVQALKEAVLSLGIPLRGEEPLVWVEQIHQHRQLSHRNAPPAGTPSAVSGTAPVSHVADTTAAIAPLGVDGREDSDSAPDPEMVREQKARKNQPLPVDDYWKWDEATPLGDLFDDIDESASADAGTEPRRWGNELGTITADEERWTPSPLAPGSAPRTGPAPSAAVALEPEETLEAEMPELRTPVTGTIATGTIDAPTDSPGESAHESEETSRTEAAGTPNVTETGGRAQPVRKAAKRQPRQRATAPGETAETGTAANPDTPVVLAAPVENVVPAKPVDVTATALATSDADEFDDLSSLFESTPAVRSPANDLLSPPMRPELFAPSASKRRRTTRTKASPPITEIPLTASVTPRELNDGMRTALLAAAAIPRPVFTRDLIGVAGSLVMVDAWEAECRADVSSSPVRFVAPKSRHRLRGHLVAVEPSVVRPGDWWYQAVQRYRAGRLYELAVLLHRVGDEIVSFTLEDQLAVFHLNTPRGLVGMIVVLDPRPVLGGSSSEGLASHLEKLLSERLTMIAVLTASAEPGSLENLISHIDDLAGRRTWQPTAPVIAARSWEYADDRGTSAVMVLGQS